MRILRQHLTYRGLELNCFISEFKLWYASDERLYKNDYVTCVPRLNFWSHIESFNTILTVPMPNDEIIFLGIRVTAKGDLSEMVIPLTTDARCIGTWLSTRQFADTCIARQKPPGGN